MLAQSIPYVLTATGRHTLALSGSSIVGMPPPRQTRVVDQKGGVVTHRIGAHRLIDRVVDTDSFESWDVPFDGSDNDTDYASALRKASARWHR